MTESKEIQKGLVSSYSSQISTEIETILRDRLLEIAKENVGIDPTSAAIVNAKLAEINYFATQILGKQFPYAYIRIIRFVEFARNLAKQQQENSDTYTLSTAMKEKNWASGVRDFLRNAVHHRIRSALHYKPVLTVAQLSQEKITALFDEIAQGTEEENNNRIDNIEEYIYKYLFGEYWDLVYRSYSIGFYEE